MGLNEAISILFYAFIYFGLLNFQCYLEITWTQRTWLESESSAPSSLTNLGGIALRYRVPSHLNEMANGARETAQWGKMLAG